MVPSACVMPTPAPRGFAVGGSPAILPAPTPSVGQGDSSAVAQAAVNAALDVVRGMRMVVKIGEREFYTVMQDSIRTVERR